MLIIENGECAAQDKQVINFSNLTKAKFKQVLVTESNEGKQRSRRSEKPVPLFFQRAF